MLSIGNKKYRNLQEQVGYNTECIKKLDEYLDGIKVEDKLVVIESDSGTFTDEELVILSGPLAFISNGSRVWMKDSETLVEFVYKAIDIKANEVGSVYYNIGGSKIVVNRETGAYNTSFDTIVTTYNKDQIDSIIANINAIKADKAELTLKANISGQAFTGAITAPSIIEDMPSSDYYLGALSSGTAIMLTYVGICKNGNKITFVVVGKAKRPTGTNWGEYTTLKSIEFRIPASVGIKIRPIGAGGGSTIVAGKKISALYSFNKYATLNTSMTKNTSISFTLTIYGTSDDIFDEEKDYAFRYEETFLLGDSLAS